MARHAQGRKPARDSSFRKGFVDALRLGGGGRRSPEGRAVMAQGPQFARSGKRKSTNEMTGTGTIRAKPQAFTSLGYRTIIPEVRILATAGNARAPREMSSVFDQSGSMGPPSVVYAGSSELSWATSPRSRPRSSFFGNGPSVDLTAQARRPGRRFLFGPPARRAGPTSNLGLGGRLTQGLISRT